MKTLTLNLTPTSTVTLTFVECAQEWDLFAGNIDLLADMAEQAGWNYQQTRERLADWAARNKELFVCEEAEKSTDELWGKTLEISEEVNEAVLNDIKHAFETRKEVKWNGSVERYGFGLKNLDEVLTHIRYTQVNDGYPPIFSVC